jgi:hypothetical protein
MNCAAHPTAGEQSSIRSIHDGIDMKGGDVGLDGAEHSRHNWLSRRS